MPAFHLGGDGCTVPSLTESDIDTAGPKPVPPDECPDSVSDPDPVDLMSSPTDGCAGEGCSKVESNLITACFVACKFKQLYLQCSKDAGRSLIRCSKKWATVYYYHLGTS